MFALPQEIEVWYVIPSVRGEFAKRLSKKYGLPYNRVGEIIGVSKSAVSQYLSNKRATKVSLKEDVKKRIDRACARIVRDGGVVLKEMQEILLYMRRKGYTCDVCKKYNQEIIKRCGGKNVY